MLRPINLCACQQPGNVYLLPSRAKDADNFLVQVHPEDVDERVSRAPRNLDDTWKRPPHIHDEITRRHRDTTDALCIFIQWAFIASRREANDADQCLHWISPFSLSPFSVFSLLIISERILPRCIRHACNGTDKSL